MRRRNFFATLLAPLLAKFAPKLGERVFPDELLKKASTTAINIVTWFAPDGTIYQVHGDRIISISDLHRRPPVIRWSNPQDPESWPWEDKDQA